MGGGGGAEADPAAKPKPPNVAPRPKRSWPPASWPPAKVDVSLTPISPARRPSARVSRAACARAASARDNAGRMTTPGAISRPMDEAMPEEAVWGVGGGGLPQNGPRRRSRAERAARDAHEAPRLRAAARRINPQNLRQLVDGRAVRRRHRRQVSAGEPSIVGHRRGRCHSGAEKDKHRTFDAR